MHIPTDALSLKDAKKSQIRLGLQGSPVSGKTYSMCTAPNLVVLDFDNKLGQHAGKDIHRIPFWMPEFCDKLVPRANPSNPPNRKDALTKWLTDNADKFTLEQTVAVDSWSLLQDGFDQQQELTPARTKTGAFDEFAFWALKQDYARNIMGILKQMKCNVIVTFHEQADRDSKGVINGKLRPLMQGRFTDKLQGYFTDWFRQVNKPILENPNDVYSKVKGYEYLWQTRPDQLCNCGSSIPGLLPYVPANWDVFVHPEKYQEFPANKQ